MNELIRRPEEPRTVDAVPCPKPRLRRTMRDTWCRTPRSHDDLVDSAAFAILHGHRADAPHVVRVDMPTRDSRLNYCKVVMSDGTVHAVKLPLENIFVWRPSP